MEYPKAVMTIRELEGLGYPRKWLMQIYRNRHQDIAWKTGKQGRTSTIYFSTQDLEKYRKAHCTGE
jgi:hypothetical protein